MSVDRVVVNASPLIVLFKSGQADLLPQLFSEILIPQAVWQEVTLPQDDAASQQLPDAAWAIPVEVSVGIATLGTGGVLVLAKRRGLIDSVGDRIQRLQAVGLWLSDSIVAMLKQQAGE
ncbi:MAG: DUF3368 domain-containing protein [Leptolyngbya sp. DLM2.Bin27]|nr:MAG: DUF3368 domain-containing protein [Leptolyngbya sp. DLM2.Bin27]